MVVHDIVLFAEEYKTRKVVVEKKRMFYLVTDSGKRLVAFFGLPLSDFELEFIINMLRDHELEVEVGNDENQDDP